MIKHLYHCFYIYDSDETAINLPGDSGFQVKAVNKVKLWSADGLSVLLFPGTPPMLDLKINSRINIVSPTLYGGLAMKTALTQ